MKNPSLQPLPHPPLKKGRGSNKEFYPLYKSPFFLPPSFLKRGGGDF